MKRTGEDNNATGDPYAVKKSKQSSEPTFAEELASEFERVAASPKYEKPKPKVVDSRKETLLFQWLDINYVDGEPLKRHIVLDRQLPGPTSGVVPVIRMFGMTDEGASVCAHVHGFTPYFWVSPPPDMTEENCQAFKDALEAQLVNAKLRTKVEKACLHVELIPNMQSLLGFHFGKRRNMLRIFVAHPTMVSTAKGILERGFTFPGGPPTSRQYMCFETNIPYELRFMIDAEIVGGNWLELPAGTYKFRHAAGEEGYQKGDLTRQSSCQVELDVVYDSIISHAPDGEWQRIAPFRTLSFDIECMGEKGRFPDPERDPVIQIGNVLSIQGQEMSVVRNVFVLGTCSSIVSADIYSFESEEEMLTEWAKFVVDCDPDILTGYNIQNFDIPYLLNRMKKLKLDTAQIWGRIRGVKASMRNTVFQSSAYGKHENIQTTIDGRITFDMIQHIRREYKLSSYSLNSVSAHFLGQQKEDVHHSVIADLQRGTADDRRRLALYCLKDSFLPQRLMDKLLVVINQIEMARVTGVPVDYLLSRGQQIKVISMLYRKCKPAGLLIPSVPRTSSGEGGGDEGYEGATVIEPIKGYYPEPIATLDFASLYPSIMQAHNLCYSTLLMNNAHAQLSPDDYEKAPDENHYFVKAHVAKGILPLILEELLAARARARKDMRNATDPFVIAVQNGRQLALKISANSVYGFTGATVGQLPCIPISSSVTSYGRQMIDQTKKAVEEHFTIANGYPANAQVIYGDTDSVMVKFGVPSVEEAMKLGREASERVTKLFRSPMRLEFEKVYYPYLLINKKRYAGLYWSKPEKWDKMETKGIETVRRDNCALVRQVIDTCLWKILVDRSTEDAVAYIKEVISDLLQNKLDISLLVITKALGKGADSDDYKAKQAHVELAERMRKRDPGSAPAVGDRVPYVIIEGAKGAPAYEKSEDPIYVLDNNIPIDTRYYLDNQLSKPITRLFEPIIDNVSSLFHGEHTRSITKPVPTQKTGIMAFAVKSARCMSCRTPLKDESHPLCVHCQPKEIEIYQRQLQLVNEQENRFSRLWTQCQRCQGSLHSDVLCSSRDCPIFYMRKKVQRDLATVTEELHRFLDF